VLYRCASPVVSSPAAPQSRRLLVLTDAQGAGVPDGPNPVRWVGSQAVVTLPEYIGVSDAGPIREQLLELLNRGAAVLITDMTGTVSCDHGGADALLRAYQRASASGALLRIAVTAPVVRRVLEASGLDRLVSIYPSAEAAIAAGTPGVIPLLPRSGPGRDEGQARSRRRGRASRDGSRAEITPAMLWGLIDALDDGVILSGDDGVLVLANRRADDMFGYRPGELIGQPVESLVPGDLRAEHIAQRAEYARDPVARPMGSRLRLAGQRQDGSTFPARVALSPVATATGRFILAVIRDITDDQPRADLAELARAAAAADDALRGRALLSRVVDGVLHVGLSLQAAIELPHEVAVQRIADALRTLDDTIREIHDHVFAVRNQDRPPDPLPPDQPG
jgi:anti-anti-sigma factor